MTATSAASTLVDTWNRRLRDSIDHSAPQPMAQGLRFAPPSLAPLDLPLGKVLVAVEDAMVALDLQRILHEAGFRVVGPATTVAEIQRMIERGDIDCAILDLDIDRRAPLPVADLLAFANVPFIYLVTGVLGPVPSRHKLRPVVKQPIDSKALLAAIETAMAKRRGVANDNGWVDGGTVVPWERVYPPI